MNTALWVMQGILAVVFLGTGLLKVLQSADKVRQLVPPPFSVTFARLLGTLEIAGAVGVWLPWLIWRLPILTPLSAVGMGLVLLAAIWLHSRQREWAKLPFISVLLVLTLIVAYGRWAMLQASLV